MESLYRLRVVWTILCALGFGVIALAFYGGTPLDVVLTAAGGLTAMTLGPYAASLFGKVSWTYFGAAILLASTASGKYDAYDFLVGGAGLYVVVVALAWVLSPLIRKLFKSDDEVA